MKKDKRNKEIEFVFDIFEEHFGKRPTPIKGGNGFDLNRGAAQRLVKRFGCKQLERALKNVFVAQEQDRYCPMCVNPLQFEKNFERFVVYFKRFQANQPKFYKNE